MRYVVNEVLVNPIATDSFGFSDKDMSYFFIINVGAVFGFLLASTKSSTLSRKWRIQRMAKVPNLDNPK